MVIQLQRQLALLELLGREYLPPSELVGPRLDLFQPSGDSESALMNALQIAHRVELIVEYRPRLGESFLVVTVMCCGHGSLKQSCVFRCVAYCHSNMISIRDDRALTEGV